MPEEKKWCKTAVVGFVLAVLAVVINLVGINITKGFDSCQYHLESAFVILYDVFYVLFWALPITSLVLSRKAIKRIKSTNHKGRGLAIAGLVISIVLLIFNVLFFIYLTTVDGGGCLPNACHTSQSIGCIDYSASVDGTVKFTLRNNLGIEITEGTLTMEGQCSTPVSNWQYGTEVDFTCQVEPGNTTFVKNFELVYKTASGTSTMTGTLRIDKRIT